MATFHLQIVIPDRQVYDGEAEKIIVRTAGGDACILARHIDYAAPLGTGEARVTDAEGNTRSAACSGGIISVSGGEVRVMATTFEWQDEIDLDRAQKAKETIEQQFATQQSAADYAMLEAKLKRALVRIQVKG